MRTGELRSTVNPLPATMCLGVTAFTVLCAWGLVNIYRAARSRDTSITQKSMVDCPLYPEQWRLICPPEAVAPSWTHHWKLDREAIGSTQKSPLVQCTRQHLRGTGLEMSSGILTPPCTRWERHPLSQVLPSPGAWCFPGKLHSWEDPGAAYTTFSCLS